MIRSGHAWKLVFFVFVILSVVGGCAHSSTVPEGHPSNSFAAKVHNDLVNGKQTDRLLTWMNYLPPPKSSWNINDVKLESYLDFAVVNQSVTAGPFSQTFAGWRTNVVEYTNPNRQAAPNQGDPDPEYTNDETTFAHASPDPVHPPCYVDQSDRLWKMVSVNEFQMEPDSLTLATLWAQELKNFTAATPPPGWKWAFGGTRNYVFEDIADNVEDLVTGSNNTPAKPCNFIGYSDWTNRSIQLITNTNADYRALTNQFLSPIIYNGLDPVSGSTPRPAIGLNPYTAGGLAENCFVKVAANGSVVVVQDVASGTPWSALVTTEIKMASAKKLFICHGEGNSTTDASGLTAQRIYQVASMLLAYDATTTVLSEDYLTGSNYKVFPEAFIVPADPLKPQPIQLSDLWVATMGTKHLYGREYGLCDIQGMAYSGCYAVANPNTTTIGFVFPAKYVSQVGLAGSSFADGGSNLLTNGSLPTSIAGGTAVIGLTVTPTPVPSPSGKPR